MRILIGGAVFLTLSCGTWQQDVGKVEHADGRDSGAAPRALSAGDATAQASEAARHGDASANQDAADQGSTDAEPGLAEPGASIIQVVEDPLLLPLTPPESEQLCEVFGYVWRLARAESLARQEYWAEAFAESGTPGHPVSAPCIICVDSSQCRVGECGGVEDCLNQFCFCDTCLAGLPPAAACDCIEKCMPPGAPAFQECQENWDNYMQCQVDGCASSCRLE